MKFLFLAMSSPLSTANPTPAILISNFLANAVRDMPNSLALFFSAAPLIKFHPGPYLGLQQLSQQYDPAFYSQNHDMVQNTGGLPEADKHRGELVLALFLFNIIIIGFQLNY